MDTRQVIYELRTKRGLSQDELANMEFLLICTYGKDGTDPELVLYKKR